MKRMMYLLVPAFCLTPVALADKPTPESSAAATTSKAMVVDSMQILQHSKRGREVISRVEERKQKAEEQLIAKGQEFETAKRAFDEKRVAMSEKAIREEERKLARMKRDLENQAQDMQAEFQEAVNMAMGELARELREVVAQEAKKQGWTRVDDLATGQVLYVASAGDVTQDMITLWDQVVVAQADTAAKKTETTTA